MGYGDEIIGSGLARGASERGKRIAFGDGRRIVWHENARLIFSGNPDVAPPGCEHEPDVEWIEHYPGKRCYCRLIPGAQRWRFIPGQVRRGRIVFSEEERRAAAALVRDGVRARLVIIEPNVKHQAPNKRWGHDRYGKVAAILAEAGYRVAQFATDGMALAGVEQIHAGSFRVACAVLQRARLYVGPEGGLHHAAAAVETKAVVIFGGFISPAVTGYPDQHSIYSGDNAYGCGSIAACDHCRSCMDKISVEEVGYAALTQLGVSR